MTDTSDLTGRVFGQWTVTGGDGHRRWSVRCSCGRASTVGEWFLKNGRTTRCKACANSQKNIFGRPRAGQSCCDAGRGVVFQARKARGMSQRQFAKFTGISVTAIVRAEKTGGFFGEDGRGPECRLKFNRAVPELRQPRPIFRAIGKTKLVNNRVRMGNCTYCRAAVEQLEHSAKRGCRPFCDNKCSALFRHHGSKPLDLTATQLTNVERYGPHVRDKTKVKLDVGLMKTVKQANERKAEAAQCPK